MPILAQSRLKRPRHRVFELIYELYNIGSNKNFSLNNKFINNTGSQSEQKKSSSQIDTIYVFWHADSESRVPVTPARRDQGHLKDKCVYCHV